jgi:hypothetical protein
MKLLHGGVAHIVPHPARLTPTKVLVSGLCHGACGTATGEGRAAGSVRAGGSDGDPASGARLPTQISKLKE